MFLEEFEDENGNIVQADEKEPLMILDSLYRTSFGEDKETFRGGKSIDFKPQSRLVMNASEIVQKGDATNQTLAEPIVGSID